MRNRGLIWALVAVLLVATSALAAPLRVVSFNIEANRDNNGNVTEGINDPGTTDFNSVRDILARINADVVCLQELANADVSGGLSGGTSSDVHALANELGLPYVFIPTSSGVFDFTLRNAILSRYPFVVTDAIGTTDYQDSIGAVGSDGERAKDVTRAIPAVVINVPDAAEPATIITLHNKSSTGLDDRFRRAVELARLEDYLERNGLDADDNIIVCGDFNLSSNGVTFTTEPTSGMPSTWNRGTDIPLPITYSTDVDFYFPSPYNLVAIDARDLNGGDATFQLGGARLDYILPSPALTVVGSEIYRSELDISNSEGLLKVGDPLSDSSSTDASDHWAVFADFELEDLIPAPTSYSLTDAAPKVVEDFDGFNGNSSPALWTSSSMDWQGLFVDQSDAANFAFDFEGDRSVGIVSGASTTFTASYKNDTNAAIEALELSYLARQFAARNPGANDTITVSLSVEGGAPVDLPELDFTAAPNNSLPFSAQLSTIVDGLTIAPGASFSLTFTAAKGESNRGTVSSEVFINEFHYDNDGSDAGEFVELVVAPGFVPGGGDLATVELVLYNGSSSQLKPYETVALTDFDNFETPTISNGYRIYTSLIPDIQNGAPDGLAVVIDGVLAEFISYEGSFTAAEGAATGITSVDIGVDQSSTFAEGFGSLGLSGSGVDSSEMTWVRFGESEAHTPGALNTGQTFTGAVPPLAQAFSFDKITVCIVDSPDNDSDGDPDISDPDDDNDLLPDLVEEILGTNPFLADSDDNGTSDFDEDRDGDGQSNGAEVLITETDPVDINSRFVATIEPDLANPGQLSLSFPTLVGRTYEIMGGSNLADLPVLDTYSGTGSEFTYPIIPNQLEPTFYIVRVSLIEEE